MVIPRIASDYEPTSGLQRAMSCDSVTSDSSILDVEPKAPKIGQLEFGLEYDRLADLVFCISAGTNVVSYH